MSGHQAHGLLRHPGGGIEGNSILQMAPAMAFDARSLRPERLSKLTGPAALSAALEICDELALPHVLFCHPAIESPIGLTQRLALLELNGTMGGTGKPQKMLF